MNDFWKASPELGGRLEGILALMDESLRSPGFPLAEEVSGIVRANGKLLRPALLVIGSRFGKAGARVDEARVDALAAAVELLHVATLIHDDVIDEAELRRGRPTLHTRFGQKEAVLAGDWLFSRCFRLAAESAGPGNAQALARLIGAICAAEIEQDLGARRYSTSVRRYYRTIAGKTAALFSLALHAGAAEAKAPARTAQALRRAGYDIGMAFQIIDDILDCESSPGELRKPVGSDLREGLCTLPLIHALRAERGAPALRPLLERLAAAPKGGSESGTLVAEILALIAESGGIELSRRAARLFTERAQAEIATLPALPARAELEALAARLLDRAY
ncbi:MAG TPA: polyprenyl synthetase family protein [Spirochaetales bacterium]|nr:polyprenyl synthetase family protein [Spirochaetales bacterium]HRY54425.1 polyprenyl synthetase family protein [Spirochaetia bacterium]HRZ65224.1 polyprenyl synthetase family protein [Spirochaetia bacterium]